MRKSGEEGVKGLRKVRVDRSNLRKIRGGVWVGAERGFSLIELIGVLTVMGILASMTVPPILRQVRQAQSGNEDANLNEVARAIVEGIKATGKIPNPNINPFDPRVGPAIDPGGWADVAYNYTTLTDDAASGGGFAPGTLHYVFPSEPKEAYVETARRIYLDPTFLGYLDSQFDGVDQTKTFATPAGGWPATIAAYGRHPAVIFPNQAIRLYIVSSSRPDFVLSCSANGPNVQVALNNYGNPAGAPLIDQLSSWVKATDPATGFIKEPGTAVENWANNAHQYLHVKTVDLRPLFCKVTLRDIAAPPTAAVVRDTHSYPANAGDPVNGTALGYTFDFVPNLGLGNAFDGGEAGILTSSLKFRTLINRTAALTGFDVKDGGLTPPANKSTFDITLPNAPQYEINNLGIQPFPVVIPPDINSSSFYLIKETIIKLYDGNVGAPTLLLNMPVTTDMNFEYFNGSWTRVD